MTTYAWDWILSEGDTITEKFEGLIKHIRFACFRSIAKEEVPVVTGSGEIGSMLCLTRPLVPYYDANPEGAEYLGRAGSTSKNPAFVDSFDIYRDSSVPRDEIRIEAGENSCTFKIFNYPFQD